MAKLFLTDPQKRPRVGTDCGPGKSPKGNRKKQRSSLTALCKNERKPASSWTAPIRLWTASAPPTFPAMPDARPTMTNKSINLSIYGSCVSRDTVSFCNTSAIVLRRYIARHSLISAYTSSPELELDLSALSSEFQKRMVLGDRDRTLAAALPLIAEDSDMLLWDLVDERLGVYLFDDGSSITRSLELIKSGAEEQIQTRARFIEFGSDAHFKLWMTALQEFVQTLDS